MGIPTRASVTCTAWIAWGMRSAPTASRATRITTSFRFFLLLSCLYSHGKRIAIESVGNSCVDSEVFVSQCDQSVGGVQIHRHLLHPNLHYQQRQDSVPQREAAAKARKGSRQRLRNLQPQPLGFLPVLLHWLQGWLLPPPLPNRFTPLSQIDLNVYRPLYIVVVVVFSARRYEDGPRAHLHPPPQASPRADAWL